MTRRGLVAIAHLALCAPAGLPAQASLVPADHAVYQWLQRQRAMGNAPTYGYEDLPLSRGRIAGLLGAMKGLAPIDRVLRERYRAEFELDTAFLRRPHTLTQGRDSSLGRTVAQKFRLVFSGREPHFLAAGDTSTNVTVDHRWGYGSNWVTEGSARQTDAFGWIWVRGFGTVERRVGLHLEWNAPYQADAMRLDPQWGKTPDAVANHREAVFAQGFASWNRGPFALDLGTGTLHLGTGAREAVVLRTFSPNFTWLRLRFESKLLQYTFLHGSLFSPTVDGTVPGFPGIPTRTAPPRWIAVRRAQIRPFGRVQLALTEALTYSNRGVELAYLNPVYSLKLAELDTGDRDNPIWFIDGVFHPARGLELYATLGIDDMFSGLDIVRPTGSRSNDDHTTKLLYQAGLTAALRSGTDLRAEFLRIEPFFYTHFLPLNTFEARGFSLANDLGPNADEIYVALKQWMPWRGWLQGSLRRVRQGLNPVDLAGQVTDVGGALTSRHVGQPILFLAGDLHHWRALGAELVIEPWPGVVGRVEYERRSVTRGTRVPGRSLLRASLALSFYPLFMLVRPLGL